MNISANFPKPMLNIMNIYCIKIMIEQIIQNIKEDALASNNRLMMDVKSYKEYLYSILDFKLNNYSETELICMFEQKVEKMSIGNIDSFDVYFTAEDTVESFFTKMKLSVVRGYIVDCIFKNTCINSNNISVN